jgi:glycine/D-amino acid oxidase-like deaminating enzyme
VHPRKGQILSLAMPGQSFHKMIRWQHTYFVPRRDGELIVGATNEDAGFDRNVTPGGIGSLLKEAQQLSSHTSSFPIVEMWTGLRPATPDGLPVIGHAEIEGLLYATGHYRNGILLAPITAAIISALVDGRASSDLSLEPYAPSRFVQK